MPPIYDDSIDESGFGGVSTLFSDSTILGEVSIDYDGTKLLLMMIIVMKLML